MAFLNEFPHFNANSMNLDWLLEQYSTFNQRLQELHDHFDEAVASMEAEIASYKAEYEQAFADYKAEINSAMTAYETSVNNTISAFETSVNSTISAFETSVNSAISTFETQVNGQVSTISNAIEQISNNVESYVENHISEWTLSASSEAVTVRSDDSAEVTTTVTLTNVTMANTPVVIGFNVNDAPAHSGYVFHTTEYHVSNGKLYPRINTYRENGSWILAVTDRKPSGTTIGDTTYNIIYTTI